MRRGGAPPMEARAAAGGGAVGGTTLAALFPPERLPMTPDSDSPLQASDFDELDAILVDLASRDDAVPPWEFLEGAMAALICTRRPIEASEWMPALLGTGPLPTVPHGDGTHFPSTERYERFMALWARREAEVRAALLADVDSLADERSYHPELVDLRGAVAAMPEAERPRTDGEPLPAFGQAWAEGFLAVVELWEDDWVPPRDKETAGWIHDALDAIAAVAEDDRGTPELNLHEEEAPPSVSQARLDELDAAIWAVYELRRIWTSLGPRSEPVRQAATPGRNDPCPCGSGKKYKKCHGA